MRRHCTQRHRRRRIAGRPACRRAPPAGKLSTACPQAETRLPAARFQGLETTGHTPMLAQQAARLIASLAALDRALEDAGLAAESLTASCSATDAVPWLPGI